MTNRGEWPWSEGYVSPKPAFLETAHRLSALLLATSSYAVQLCVHAQVGISCWSACLSVINVFGSYSESDHLGSCLSTQSNENAKLTPFQILCLIDDKKLVFCEGIF